MRKLSIFTCSFLCIISYTFSSAFLCTRKLFTDKQLLYNIKSSIEVLDYFTNTSNITHKNGIVSSLRVLYVSRYAITSHLYTKWVD